MGASSIALILLMPSIGELIDRRGRLPVLRLGYAAMILLGPAFALVDGLSPLVVVLRFAQGAAFAAAFGAANALALDLAPPDRIAQTLGRFGMATLLTHALGPVLGERLVAYAGWNALFISSGVFAALALAASFGIRETLRAPRQAHATPAATLSGAVGLARSAPAALGALALTGLGFGAALNFIPLQAASHGMPAVAPFFVAYVVAALASRLLLGSLADRVGRARVATPALLGFGCALLAASAIARPWHLPAVGAAFGACHGAYYPALSALALDAVGTEARGRMVGLTNVAFNIGISAGGWVLGPVARAWGTGAALAVAGGAGLLAGLWMFRSGGGAEKA
jgi:MFS family permease